MKTAKCPENCVLGWEKWLRQSTSCVWKGEKGHFRKHYLFKTVLAKLYFFRFLPKKQKTLQKRVSAGTGETQKSSVWRKGCFLERGLDKAVYSRSAFAEKRVEVASKQSIFEKSRILFEHANTCFLSWCFVACLFWGGWLCGVCALCGLMFL